MLTLYDPTGEVHPPPADLGSAALLPEIVWIDLVQPNGRGVSIPVPP